MPPMSKKITWEAGQKWRRCFENRDDWITEVIKKTTCTDPSKYESGWLIIVFFLVSSKLNVWLRMSENRGAWERRSYEVSNLAHKMRDNIRREKIEGNLKNFPREKNFEFWLRFRKQLLCFEWGHLWFHHVYLSHKT